MRLVIVVFLVSAVGFAQKVTSVRAGLVYATEGEVAINGEPLPETLVRAPQLENGQTITTAGGATEILMGPSSVLWMRAGTRLRFDDTSLDRGRITLLVGSLLIEVKETEPGSALQVDMDGHVVELREPGLFRFDAIVWRTRVYAGSANLLMHDVGASAQKLPAGREATSNGLRRFDGDAMDGFHWWAAARSLALEKESGRRQAWKLLEGLDGQQARHAGFGVTLPWEEEGARIKYMTSGVAGLLYEAPYDVWVGAGEIRYRGRLPLAVPAGDFIRPDSGRAGVFLGKGAVAWMETGAQLRMLDTRVESPGVAVEGGVVVIEVGSAKNVPVLQVHLERATTSLRRLGVYGVDAARHTLSVYDGEAEVVMAARKAKVRAGERVDVMTGRVTKLAVGEDMPLLAWAANESFAVYLSRAGFLTGWKQAALDHEAQHAVFGRRRDARVPLIPRDRLALPPPEPDTTKGAAEAAVPSERSPRQ